MDSFIPSHARASAYNSYSFHQWDLLNSYMSSVLISSCIIGRAFFWMSAVCVSHSFNASSFCSDASWGPRSPMLWGRSHVLVLINTDLAHRILKGGNEKFLSARPAPAISPPWLGAALREVSICWEGLTAVAWLQSLSPIQSEQGEKRNCAAIPIAN